MNQQMLDYTLREAATGIRMMARDRAALHVFDWGRTPEGEEYVFLMAALPKRYLAQMEAYLRAPKPIAPVPSKPPAEA